MDWKTYEQGKAVGAELKARREAEAKAAAPQKPTPQKSAQPSAATQPGAPARKAPAKPAAVTTVGAPVAAKPTQTKPSAASVVTPPVTEATRKSTLDADLRQDLNLQDLYKKTRTRSTVDTAVGEVASTLGVAPQRYKELAAIQGVDLEDLDKKARNGMPFENYRQAKKDAIGFVPVEQRAAMFEEVAKDYAAAEKGEVRTDKRIGVAAAEEAPGTIPGFTTGYVVGGTTAEETPEVVKPGEHYYAIAQKFIEAVDKDPEAVKLVNLYGNSLAGGASQKYINDRTRQLMKNKGITPDSPDADRQAGLARRQAMYEVLARKTVGQWTPAVFVKDVQVTDDAEAPDNPFAALYPNIELIGFNNKGDAVFRQESPAGVMLRTLDLIGVVPIPGKGKVIPVPIPGQSLLAGLATKGEDESYTAAMSRGVQTGANWLEYALDESKGAPLPVRALAGTAGLVASVVHPDVTAAAGSLNEAQKALRVTYKNKQIAKEAVPILEELIEAYRANQFDRASALEKKLADNELLGTRAKGHSIVKAYDRNDAAFAMALASMNPALKHTSPFLVDDLVAKIGAKGDDALTEFVYETAGKGAPHMHFSAAAPELAERTKEGAVGASFMTFLDAGNFQRRKERIQAALDAYKKAIPQTAEAALSKTVDDAVDFLKRDPDSARMAGVPEDEIKKSLRLAELMEQNKAMLIADPVDGAEQFKAILRADPTTGGDANATWRAGVYRKELGRTTKRLKELKAKDYQAVLSDDLQMFNDALAAVDTNVKSRMMAAESLRRNLAERANIEITPIDILDDMVLEPGTERLSPYAQAGFFTAVRQFPMEEMDRKELYLAYQALDQAFQGVAERHGVPVETIWRDLFVQVEQGKAELPGAAAAKAAGKPPPAPPATLPATPGDVSKLANVPKGDPKLEAAITEAAKEAQKVTKAKAGAKAAAMPHPQTAEVLAKLTGLPAEAKATPENVSKILKAVDTLGAGATFPTVKGFPGQTKKLVDAVRDQLLESGVLVKMDDGKVVKAGGTAAPAPVAAPVKAVEPAATEVAEVYGLAEARENLSKVNAEIEDTDDLIRQAEDMGDVDEETRLKNLLGNLERTQKILENRVENLKARAPAPKVEAPAAARPLAEDINAAKNVPGTLKTPEVAKQLEAALEATPYGTKFELPGSMGADAQLYLPTVLTDRGDLWFEEGKGYLRTVGGVQPSTTPERLRDELEDVRGTLKRRPGDAQLSRRATLIEDAIKRLEAEAPAAPAAEAVVEAAPVEAKAAPVVAAVAEETHPLTSRALEHAKRLAADPDARGALIGRGGNADVFEVPGDPDLVVRAVRRRDAAKDVEMASPTILPNPAGEANIGQPLVSVGGMTIHVRQTGFPAGMSSSDPAYRLANRDEIYAQRIRAAAELPQEAYDRVARDLLRANDVGLVWDPSKSNNILIDPQRGQLGLVDLSPRNPGSSYRNSAADIVVTLSGNTHAYTARELIPTLEAARRQIIEKAQIAAERTGIPFSAGEGKDSSLEYSMQLAGMKSTKPAAPKAAEAVVEAPAPAAAPVVEAPAAAAPAKAAKATRGKKAAAPVAAPAPAPVVEAAPVATKIEPTPAPVPAVPAVKPAATLENLGNREIWSATKAKGRIQTKVDGADFFISTVPVDGKPPIFRISMKAGDELKSLGGNFESLEDALRALTPTASGPAPLRADIDKVMRAQARPASITKPKVAPVQAEEIVDEALDTGVPEQVAKLEAEAPAVVEEAAPAAPKQLAPEEMRAKAVDELGKITHSVVKADGTKVYGVVEGDMFVPKYTLAPGEMRDSTDALYFKASRGSMAVDEPRTLKEVGAQPESLQRVVQKIQNMDESDLYQTAMVDGKLVQKGKFEVLTPEQIKELRNKDSATAMITLFRGAADPTTLLHEGAHYIRRMGLDSDDMDAITKWIKTEGVDVTNYYGTFKGTPEAVEQAEELFARAFEQYMLKGEAPQPALKVLFEKVKDVFVKVYRNLARGPLGKEIRPEVKAVFDRLFTRVPDKKPESTFDMLMRHTFNNKGMEQEGGLTVLAREAKRRGMGGKSVEDLAKLVADAPKKYGNDKWLESVVIDFPVAVFGKTEWTGADILELSNRVQTRRNDLALAPLKQALFGDPEEEALTESIFTALLPKQGEGFAMTATRTVGSVFAHSIIGGDIVDERKMRNLLPEVRRSLNTSTRIIEQAIGDTITVLEQTIRTGDMNFMYRYLAGETGMTYESGRRVISSGHEFIDGFMSLYRNAGNALTSADQALLQDFAQAINTRPDLLADAAKVAPQFRSEALARLVYPTLEELDEAKAAAREAGERLGSAPVRGLMQDKATALMNAINKFRNLKGTDDIGVGSMLAVAMKGALGEGSQPSINEFRFTETLLYLAGITPRNGELFVEAGKDYSKANLMAASKTLLDDAQKIYGTAEDQLVARRLSILVGAYGSASRAKAELADLGLVLTAEERTAYNDWALGYGVTPEMRPRIEGAMRKLGANTDFQPDTILGVDMYIPLQARQRIADALQKAQFSEKRLTKAGDLYQMAFAFIKKRMTRGNFVLRQRYFMVNTIDHFFQMSLIIGYAPAFQSMARVALQNVMASLPGQVFETLVRGINLLPGAKINPAVVEKVRDALSRGGDQVAFGLRKMFSDAKYRVEVNHVLEGRNIPIVIGGHVTTGKRLREIMVGEGILESYNTRRLGQVIRQEGTAFLNDGDGIVQAGIDDSKLKGNVTTAWAKVSNAAKDILAFEMNIVDDIGDAWAERERVGAAVTLIENGYEPRLACRLTVDALYDYAQSMTKGDRSWLVSLMFPFWAFQKNANQQFINVLATPYGAYRMMVMKRFRDRGSELLTELYYDAVGGELGLDVNEMPQDMQDMYYAIMTKAHEVYGDEIPEDAKLALRMALTGRASEVIDGKYYELDDSLISMLKAGGVAGVGGAAMSEYMLPRPDPAILPSYMRERPGVFIAQRRNAMVRMYAGLRGKNDEMFYLMVPEASFEAAFKHVATVFGTGLMLGGYATAMTPAGPMLGLEETGLEGTELLQAIKPVLDLERSPIAGPVIGMYAERGYPQRLDPWFASLIQNLTDVPVLRVPAANDPFESDNFLLEMEKIGTEGGPKDINEILGADYVRTVQELNSKDIDPNDLSTIREERFYLPPGGYSIAFENTLGELNKELLLKWSRSPAERAESAELLDMGNILFMLRNLTGLELASVSASRTAQQEEPVFYTKSSKPF